MRPEHYILDEQGEPQPVDWLTWAKWFETVGKDARRVAADSFPDGVVVSTVFLGHDHQYFEGGPPLLYETLVFEGPHDGEMARYTTRAEALAGHRAMCEVVRGPSRFYGPD